MITLHGFGPAFGLPDPSPFVMKAEILLKMSGLDYRKVRADPRKGPRGKIPWIDDGGLIVPDSTLIRFHLEHTYGIDFDNGLSPSRKGAAWAIERMLEEHVYWLVAVERWRDPTNFARGPRMFFDPVPALIRPLVVAMVGRQFDKTIRAHGIGRYTPQERTQLAERAAGAVSDCLGSEPWLMGGEPTAVDAVGVSFIAGAIAPHFDGTIRRAFERHANLVDYARRGIDRWFSEPAPAF